MNLFELSNAYKRLADRDDLDPQVIADTLDALDDDRKTKLDNIASMIDQLKAESEVLSDKAKSFREEATYRKNKAKWLQQYLTDYLDSEGIKKIDTENHVLRTQNNPAYAEIWDIDQIPAEYRNYAKYEGLYDVMKKEVLADLKKGEEVPGARLKQTRRTVIK